MNETQKAASLALDKYVAEQRAPNESEAMTYDRLVKSRDVNLAALYAASQGRGLPTTDKAAQSGLDAALMQRAEMMKRDGETVEQSLARLVREGDVIVKALYRASHG